MPQCCYSNIQQSIGTFLSAIPGQLLYTFGIAFWAGICGLVVDGEFATSCGTSGDQKDQNPLKGEHCAFDNSVPWIFVWIFGLHFVLCVLNFCKHLKRDYDTTMLTTSPGNQRKVALLNQFVSGTIFWFLLFLLLECTLFVLAWNQEGSKTSFAVSLIPTYLALAMMTVSFFFTLIRRTQEGIFVIFVAVPGAMFSVLSLAQVPLIVLKLDESLSARWAVILVPYWIGVILSVCAFCGMWTLSAVDLVRHRHPASQSPEADTGKIFSVSLFGLICFLSILSFFILLCESEDDLYHFSGFRISSTIWGAWILWTIVYLVDQTADFFYRTRNCCVDMQAKRALRERERLEAESRKLHYDSTGRNGSGSGSNARERRADDVETGDANLESGSRTADSKTSHADSDDDETIGSSKQNAANDGADKDRGPSDSERRFTQLANSLEYALDEHRIIAYLSSLLELVRESRDIATDANQERLIAAATQVRAHSKTEWTRDVAQLFGRVLREFSGLGLILSRRIDSLRRLRVLREKNVPGPPAF
eukprot:g2028.t1